MFRVIRGKERTWGKKNIQKAAARLIHKLTQLPVNSGCGGTSIGDIGIWTRYYLLGLDDNSPVENGVGLVNESLTMSETLLSRIVFIELVVVVNKNILELISL